MDTTCFVSKIPKIYNGIPSFVWIILICVIIIFIFIYIGVFDKIKLRIKDFFSKNKKKENIIYNNSTNIDDLPISEPSKDEFNRLSIAKSIANLIILKSNDTSQVIGIYGKWGQGKTSFLYFIDNEIKEQKNILSLWYKPWVINDDDKLLNTFFLLLIRTIIKLKIEFFLRVKNKEKLALIKYIKFNIGLKWWKFKFRRNITKYDDIINEIPKLGKLFSAIFNKIKKNDYASIKNRIDNLLKKYNFKLVIFIDDIDRLGKNEIQIIFHMIKLIGDLSNITYILAFDLEMVSKAISVKYGKKNSIKDGENFIEKIIQIPINLPIIKENELYAYFIKHLESFINNYIKEIDKEDWQRFNNLFNLYLFKAITNPRKVKRVIMSLQITFPNIINELNLTDFLLIEFIRILYPSYYEFIRTQKKYFITYNDSAIEGDNKDQKKSNLNKMLLNIDKDISELENKNLYYLLIELFPSINSIINNITLTNDDWSSYSSKKMVCSPLYFEKYFSYTISDYDISDSMFKSFIDNLKLKNIENSIIEFKTFITSKNSEQLFLKLLDIENNLDNETIQILIKILINFGNILSKETSVLRTSEYSRISFFIVKLINKLPIDNSIFDLYRLIFTNAKPIEFAIEIFKDSFQNKNVNDKILSSEGFKNVFTILINEIATFEAKPIYFNSDQGNYIICHFWSHLNKEAFCQYIKYFMDKNPKDSLDFIKMFLPIVISSSPPYEYKSNFGEEQLKQIIDLFDLEYLYNKVIFAFGDGIISKDRLPGYNGFIPDDEILKQFTYWYHKYKENNNNMVFFTA